MPDFQNKPGALVSVDVGTLHLSGVGYHGGDTEKVASFRIEFDATLLIGGSRNPTHQVRDKVTFEGEGLLVVKDGILEVPAGNNVSIAGLQLKRGGELLGAGTFTVALMYWDGGWIHTVGSGIGSVVVTTLRIRWADEKFINNSKLTLKETATWEDGDVWVSEGTQVENLGLFDVKCDKSMKKGAGAMSQFTNAAMTGVFRKSEGAGTTTIEIDWKNLGKAELKTGKVEFKAKNQHMGVTELDGGNLAAAELIDVSGILQGYGDITGNVLLSGQF